jgi:cytochrome d ubiquinol oxidase subunit II
VESGISANQIGVACATALFMTVMLVSLEIGALLLVPSMTWLFVIFQRGQPRRPGPARAGRPGPTSSRPIHPRRAVPP